MGMGEPLANYKRVMHAVHRVVDDAAEGLGMSARGITVSTVGLVPAIRKLADEDLPVTFALSLHAPDDELRDELIPVNSRWKVDEALDAAYDYYQQTGRRVSIEYALIKDMNDHAWRADLLAKKLNKRGRGWVHVNPIPLNPTPGSIWTSSERRQRRSSSTGSTTPASPPRCATPAARRSTAPAANSRPQNLRRPTARPPGGRPSAAPASVWRPAWRLVGSGPCNGRLERSARQIAVRHLGDATVCSPAEARPADFAIPAAPTCHESTRGIDMVLPQEHYGSHGCGSVGVRRCF